jgi:hypothetical protein
MSTRCQIAFHTGEERRTVYRHWDGYPSAVLADLQEFLQWSVRGADVEYVTANFLYWSKRGLDARSEQLGFGICANDELHGDIAYFYEVDLRTGTITAYRAEWQDGGIRLAPLRGAP